MKTPSFLYEAKRYKSAMPLAVLAAEEIGKILILPVQDDLNSKG